MTASALHQRRLPGPLEVAVWPTCAIVSRQSAVASRSRAPSVGELVSLQPWRSEMRARIAWALVVLSVVCAVLDTVIIAAQKPLLSHEVYYEHGWPIVPLATLGAAVMGALIVSRYPKHPIGWLLVVTGSTSIAVAGEAYEFWPPFGSGHTAVTAAHMVGWVSALFGSPLGITCLIVIFLIAPDGRLRSRIARLIVLTGLVGFILYIAGVVSLTPTGYDVNDLGPATNAYTS